MLRNRAKRKYGTVAQEIQFSEFYRTAIIVYLYRPLFGVNMSLAECKQLKTR